MKGVYKIPCEDCLVYAACYHKERIFCTILYKHLVTTVDENRETCKSAFEYLLNDYRVYLNKRFYGIHYVEEEIELVKS